MVPRAYHKKLAGYAPAIGWLREVSYIDFYYEKRRCGVLGLGGRGWSHDVSLPNANSVVDVDN